MDNEMMKKVNDTLKANGMRELSMDEMGKVSGGAFSLDRDTGMCNVNGKNMTAAEFTSLIVNTANIYGYDYACNLLNNITGYTCEEMGNRTNTRGTDDEKIGVLMNRFWANYEGGRNW